MSESRRAPAKSRLTKIAASCLLAVGLAVTPTQSGARALPEDYPPDFGGAFPMAVIAVPFGLGLYPLLVIPAVSFDGLDGASKLWNRMVWEPIYFYLRDRSGEGQY